MEKNDAFNDFKEQALRIAEHSDEVETLYFNARLKNGTKFNFSYNESDKWKSMRGEKRINSVANAVTDIASAACSIVIIVMLTFKESLSFEALTLSIVTASLFVALFVFSAVYHLFEMSHEKAISAMSGVREGAVAASLLSMGMALIVKRGWDMPLVCLMLIFAFAEVFFYSLLTRGGIRASSICRILLSAVIMMVAGIKSESVFLFISVATSSICQMISVGKDSKAMRTVRTNGIFLFAALLMFYFLV